jgi:CRISPR-associated protein Cmx8
VQIPDIIDRSATNAVVRLTRRSVQDLFDDLYAAEVVEVRTGKRWPGSSPKREEPNPSPRPGEPKRWLFYNVVQPAGPFLRRYTDDGKEAWHKLWREMIWKVQRSRHTTRAPYNNRAQGEPTGEGEDAWKELVVDERAKGTGSSRRMVELASAVMLGVQAINAELVPFEDRAYHHLLLHFWPLTARVFVPEVIDAEGRRNYPGFALAIPDVSDLTAFCRAFMRFLGDLRPQQRGYRPADAVISLPEQASLEFMRHFDELATRHVIAEGPARFIAGVEYFQMLPTGQNVKVMAHGRVPPEDRLLSAYAGIRQSCRNPLFCSCSLQAALRGEPWFTEFLGPLTERDWPFFVHSIQERKRTPPAMIGFAWDADRRFQSIRERYRQMKEAMVPDPQLSPEAVDGLIYDLVYHYVKERACARSGVKPDDAQWWSKTAEERRDVCSKLFLELRSRNDDDFVRHFTATLGSVPQWLGEQEFLTVAAALIRPYPEETGSDRPRTREDVKTLTLLALSAHSRSYKPRDRDDADTQNADPEEAER